jgi:putative oxidoreductase
MNVSVRTNVAILVLRVGIGLILMYYGSQKVFGLFGGFGPQKTISFFQEAMKIPPPFTILAMVAELGGGLSIVFGLLTSVAAFGAACTMAVATYENLQRPGVLDAILHGGGDPSPPLFTGILCCAAIAIMIMGAGNYSLDARIFKPKRGKR